jgi:transposase InsO family protein
VGGIYRVNNDGLVQIPVNNYNMEKQSVPRMLQIKIRYLTDEMKLEGIFEILDEEQLIKAMDIDETKTPWYFENQNRRRKEESRLERLERLKQRRDAKKPLYDNGTILPTMEELGAIKEEEEMIIPTSLFAQPALIEKSVPPVDERFENAINAELPKTALSKEGKEILRNTLRSFRDVISFKDEPLGHSAIFEQDIALTTNRVIRIPQFPLGQEQHGPIAEWVEQMLQFGIIRPSRSPYNSPCMMVRKPKGGWRMVIDFREINKFLAHDPYPLPDINRTLQGLGKNGSLLNFISSLDLLWGFYHIEIQEPDRQKTAFTVPQGRFEYERLPMGMKTSPAAFQRLVDMIIMQNMGGNIFCYVDDVLCYSETEKAHLLHLTKLFAILRKFGMKLNMDKSLFARNKVAHLGHILTSTGVQMDTTKLKKMEDLPTPKTRKQLKGLLGIASYYRRFVPDFAKIVRPMTNLLRQDEIFEWKEKQENARKILLDALKVADELEYILQKSVKIITIGFDEHTLSAMLSQERKMDDGKKNEKPILFASKVLSPAESRGKEDAKSLKAAKFAIQQFRPYLRDGEVIIRTNDRVLMQLQERSAKELTATQAKWVSSIKDLNPKFEYKATKTNTAVNSLGACWEDDPAGSTFNTIRGNDSSALSNKTCNTSSKVTREPQCAYLAPSFQHELYDPILVGNEWIDLQERDAHLTNIKQKYTENDPSVTPHYYIDPAGILYRQVEGRILPVVPVELREKAVQLYHDTPRAGHYAARRTYLAMKRSVWWKNMECDVKDYVNRCVICQYYKLKTGKAPHMPRTIPVQPFYLVSIDLVGPLKTTAKGFKYIMVVQDAFSKWIEMIPLRDAKASTVAEMFMNQIVVRYGPPMKILTDRGSQFTSNLFQKMCDFLGIRSTLTTAYRPQCNGANERTHRELKRYLNMFMSMDGSEKEIHVPWDTLARYAAWAYNTSYHAVLRTTPYEVMFGRSPQVHALGALGGQHQLTERIMKIFGDDEQNLDQNVSESKLSAEDARLFRMIKLDREITETLRQNIKKELMKAQQRWVDSTQRAEDGPSFEPGDYILLRNMRATSNVMIPKYTGPYEVLSRKSPVNYEILRMEPHFAKKSYRDTVHIDRMKAYINPNPGKPIVPLFLEPEPPAESDEVPEYVDILEITPAGLEATIRMPADSGQPVPIVEQYLPPSAGNIEHNMAQHAGGAGMQHPKLTEAAGIQSAKEDPYPDPVPLHMKQWGAVTRSKARKIGLKVAELFSVGNKNSE